MPWIIYCKRTCCVFTFYGSWLKHITELCSGAYVKNASHSSSLGHSQMTGSGFSTVRVTLGAPASAINTCCKSWPWWWRINSLQCSNAGVRSGNKWLYVCVWNVTGAWVLLCVIYEGFFSGPLLHLWSSVWMFLWSPLLFCRRFYKGYKVIMLPLYSQPGGSRPQPQARTRNTKHTNCSLTLPSFNWHNRPAIEREPIERIMQSWWACLANAYTYKHARTHAHTRAHTHAQHNTHNTHSTHSGVEMI